MADQKPSTDSLHCAEEHKLGEIEDDEKHTNNNLFSDDEEDLRSLFAKERVETTRRFPYRLHAPRKRAVEWLLRVNSLHGFSPVTATLAVDYLDRFLLLSSSCSDRTRPWAVQLAAVACLSLAGKVEETHVPLLLDLQADDAMHAFEAKTIQRMELMVLAALQWRMNPVTPLSFLDHAIRRLGFNACLHRDFLDTCHNIILNVISDSRLIHYLPSVFATATMLHVIHRVDPTNGRVYENHLLGFLKLKKDDVDECYEIISDVLISKMGPMKRELGRGPTDEGSSSNDSWASSAASCVSTTSPSPVFKKARRIQEQQMRLPSLCRVFVGSPN